MKLLRFLLGVLLAGLLSIAATIPYLSTSHDYAAVRDEMYSVAVGSKNVCLSLYPQCNLTSLVEVKLVALLPRAMVESNDAIATVRLTYLVTVDPKVTELTVGEPDFGFDLPQWNLSIVGRVIDFPWSGIGEYSNNGSMPPFAFNLTMAFRSFYSVSQDWSHLLYLADKVESHIFTGSHGWVLRVPNGTRDSGLPNYIVGSFAPAFDLVEYPIMIYRFNYPPLWIACAASVIIVAYSAWFFFREEKRLRGTS